MCLLMVHVCRFNLQDLLTVLQVMYAVVYVCIYGKNIRLEKWKGWMWCCCVMNIFMIFFWVFVRLLSSLKWYDSLYDCWLFYNTSYSEPLPAICNTTMHSFHHSTSPDISSEGCSETSATSEGNLKISSNSAPSCQGTICFPLQKHLRVFPTPTLDTFGILQTPTTSEFQRHFRVLLILSPFQQSPTLLHAPSTPTPCLTPPLKIAPSPPPPLKVAWRPLQTPYPPIWTPLWHSSETLQVIVEIGRLLQHPILRVKDGQDWWGVLGDGPGHELM